LAISGIKVAIIAGLLQLLTVAIAGRRVAIVAVGGRSISDFGTGPGTE
jgi:hypothetical protein